MSIFEAIILGLLQGLTEFIPVSSSGHLILAHEILGTTENTLSFDVALHVGTLLALFIFFKKDIVTLICNLFAKNSSGRLARLLALATIPAILAGLLFADYIDEHMRTPLVVACTLGVAGIIMLIAEHYASSSVDSEKVPSTKQGLTVGIAQALALIPGISRSGATITAGFFARMGKEQATRFSFLLAIPIIAGSALGILLRDGGEMQLDGTLLIGVFTAFAAGLFAIKFMLGIVGKVGLKPFAYYRITLSLIVFIALIVR